MRDAYDVLHALNRAGVHLIVTGDRLHWRCDPTRLPVQGSLFLKLRDQKMEIARILLNVPADCPQPDICSRLGICPREIASRACSDAAPTASTLQDDEVT